jgi:hypothetical protein
VKAGIHLCGAFETYKTSPSTTPAIDRSLRFSPGSSIPRLWPAGTSRETRPTTSGGRRRPLRNHHPRQRDPRRHHLRTKPYQDNDTAGRRGTPQEDGALRIRRPPPNMPAPPRAPDLPTMGSPPPPAATERRPIHTHRRGDVWAGVPRPTVRRVAGEATPPPKNACPR